jgi:hypothetical protein
MPRFAAKEAGGLHPVTYFMEMKVINFNTSNGTGFA